MANYPKNKRERALTTGDSRNSPDNTGEGRAATAGGPSGPIAADLSKLNLDKTWESLMPPKGKIQWGPEGAKNSVGRGRADRKGRRDPK